MVAGIFDLIRSSELVVWVAIALACGPSFIQKIEHRLRDVASSLSTIFSHPDERVPVPGMEQGEKHEPGQFELAARRDKAIEIRQLVAASIADSLDAIKRDAPHLSQPSNPGGLHVNQGGRVSGGKTLLLL